MKRIIFVVFLFATSLAQPSFAQDSVDQQQLAKLFTSYLGIKDALVASNTKVAADKAEEFVKTINGIDYKVISENNVKILLKDATHISEAKDVNKQRDFFANLSINVGTLAKSVKLSAQPVYQMYCPMKKTYWLSDEKAIKNPYYGSSMLTCGKVVETIN